MSTVGKRVWTAAIAFAVVLGMCTGAGADPRTEYLVRLLQSSTQFRVRAQAAISLGRTSDQPAVLEGLAGALNDEHPAVRAAAASSLERLGNASMLPALRRRANDSHPEVRAAVESAMASLQRGARPPSAITATQEPQPQPEVRGTPQFYVGVGMPGSRVPGLDEGTLARAQAFLKDRVRVLDGVVLAPSDETPKQAEAVIRGRALTGFFIDSSIVSVEQRADGAVRVSVSVILGTYPGRDMRSILQGAATVMGGGAESRGQAIEAAFTGALRNLSQAMAASRR